jgi:hypothetical protein
VKNIVPKFDLRCQFFGKKSQKYALIFMAESTHASLRDTCFPCGAGLKAQGSGEIVNCFFSFRQRADMDIFR